MWFDPEFDIFMRDLALFLGKVPPQVIFFMVAKMVLVAPGFIIH